MDKYLVISDIHFGHRINKVEKIGSNLINFLHVYKNLLEDLDVIFIAGDLFDTFLPNYSNTYLTALGYITEIIQYCKERNIKLRILEGTPSHDWKQAKSIYKIINDLGIQLDFKYIDDLYIEVIGGKHILYIPDEYKPTGEETYKDVLKLLKKHNLEKVDIGIFHGSFKYQLPIDLSSSLIEEDFLKIITGYIHIGHIHTHSTYKRIIAQGSFDRLAHGEEEDKGGVLVDLKASNYLFLKNPKAMIFKTLDYVNIPLEDIALRFKEDVQRIPPNSSIRILVKNSEISSNLNKLNFIKSNKIFTIKIVVKKDKKLEKVYSNKIEISSLEVFEINRNNIKDLVEQELIKLDLTKEEFSNSIKLMEEIWH